MSTNETKQTPHPNAEVIKAWADGKEIERYHLTLSRWVKFIDGGGVYGGPWHDSDPTTWRIKPGQG